MEDKKVIFIAGVYGVGKSYLCDRVAQRLGIRAVSASEIIASEIGEKYGRNKAVKDKDENQKQLVKGLKHITTEERLVLLAGHFCIWNKWQEPEDLPSNVFEELGIEKVVLLTADSSKIQANLLKRDYIRYELETIDRIKKREFLLAKEISAKINAKLLTHDMHFDESDIEVVAKFICEERGQ